MNAKRNFFSTKKFSQNCQKLPKIVKINSLKVNNQIGTQKLNIQKQYKYLGEHFTENVTLVYHLKEKECQVEGIMQSFIFVSSDGTPI